jgi:RNA polymerase sigma-70 factor (ECF subfamily)
VGEESSESSPQAHAEHAEDLLAQVFRLPIQQREVLALVAVEQMSYADVSTVLAVPAATVFARLVQARESLRSGTIAALAAPKGAG